MDKHIYTRLIDSRHPLPPDFVPRNLVDMGIPFDAPPGAEKRLLESHAARAALSLIRAARAEGMSLYGISGYRSYLQQKQLYSRDPTLSPPGESEHQTGLALDLSCSGVNMQLTKDFCKTPEGLWLARNASLYGFILRYPKNKQHITEMPYEPWHIRYVTKPLAACLSLTDMTLEEFHLLTKQL